MMQGVTKMISKLKARKIARREAGMHLQALMGLGQIEAPSARDLCTEEDVDVYFEELQALIDRLVRGEAG